MPARLRDLKRRFAGYGINVSEPGKGSHWKAERGGLSYRIPAHNGLKTEIGDTYIRACCRHFGIDYAEFIRGL